MSENYQLAMPAPAGTFSAITEPFRLILRHRELILSLAKRDVTVPYAGQMLSWFWALAHPLFLVVLYAVVFNFLLGARFGGTPDLPLDYTVYLLSGLIPWLSLILVLGRSCTEVVSNGNLVKQVVFPLETLPVKGIITAAVNLAVGLTFIAVYVVVKTGGLPWTFALLPIVVALELIWMIGLNFLFSCLAVFFRDLKDFVRIFVTAGMYLLPIIFLPSSIPTVLKPIIYVNPGSYMVWAYRDVLYFGKFNYYWAWPVFIFISLGTFYGGFYLFRRLKPYFGNAL